MLAAICILPMTMAERRVLPRWLGVVAIVLVALPALAAAATGLPGLPGLTMPVWLIAFGVVLTRRAG